MKPCHHPGPGAAETPKSPAIEHRLMSPSIEPQPTSSIEPATDASPTSTSAPSSGEPEQFSTSNYLPRESETWSPCIAATNHSDCPSTPSAIPPSDEPGAPLTPSLSPEDVSTPTSTPYLSPANFPSDDPPAASAIEPSTLVSLNGNRPRSRHHVMQILSSPPASPSSQAREISPFSLTPQLSTATSPLALGGQENVEEEGADELVELNMDSWPVWIEKAWETLSGERAPVSPHWKTAIMSWAHLEEHYGFENPNGVVCLSFSITIFIV